MRLWIARFYRFIGKMETRRKFKKCWKCKAKLGYFDKKGFCSVWGFSLNSEEKSCENCPYKSNIW